MASIAVGRDALNLPAHKQLNLWTVPELAERYGITRQSMKDYLIYHYSAIPPTFRISLRDSDMFFYDESAVKRIDKQRLNSPLIRMGVVPEPLDGVEE